MIFNTKTKELSGVGQNDTDLKSQRRRLIPDESIVMRIEFDEISVPKTTQTTDTGDGEQTATMGILYPVIRINDVVLARENIIRMVINSTGFVPTITLNLAFSDTTFANKNAIKDGDMISTFMRCSSPDIKYLRNDFIITSCTMSTSRDSRLSATLTGKMFIKNFDAKYGMTFYSGTSKLVMKNIAREFGLGFEFNDYDNTDDFQGWYKCNETVESFVTDVIEHAWKDELSFFKCWVNIYYDICFVNVNKFLLSSEDEDEIDLTITSNELGMSNLNKNSADSSTSYIAAKVLTNLNKYQGSPFYIKSWKPYNNSSSISFSSGYAVDSLVFLHNQNLLNEDTELCFKRLNNHPVYDTTKEDTHIVLRGRPKYDKDKNPQDEMERINYNFVDTYNNKEWAGIEYVLSDDDVDKEPNEWSGNVCLNYRRSMYHNNINSIELDKIYIKAECEGLCLQVMRGEKVPVYIVHTDIRDTEANAAVSPSAKEDAMRFYCGYYFVDGVSYEYNPQKKGLSPFTTTFTLKRREWPTPEQI